MREQLDLYIRARYPLALGGDGRRTRVRNQRNRERWRKAQRKRLLLLWSGTVGLINPAAARPRGRQQARPVGAAASTILEDKEPCLWVLRDFHPFLKDAGRSCGGCARWRLGLQRQQQDRDSSWVPCSRFRPNWKRRVSVVDFDLPTAEQIQAMIDGVHRKHCSQSKRSRSVALDQAPARRAWCRHVWG
jgi:hypothetical protein